MTVSIKTLKSLLKGYISEKNTKVKIQMEVSKSCT